MSISGFAARFAIALVLVAPAACTNPGIPESPPRFSGVELPLTVRGDWDDLSAAFDRAAPRAAVAPVRTRDEPTTETQRRTVEFLAVDGQSGSVTFSALRTEDPRAISIEARFGSPNDTGRAAALVSLIAAEIEALAGRAIAPR